MLLQGLGALNVFDLRSAPIPQQRFERGSVGQSFGGFNLDHPRVADSDGVQKGTSPLARRLDIIS